MDLKDLIRKWAEKARDDLIVAETLFQNTHPKQIYIACYHCQQAVEKMLKCYLVFNNIEPPKTHDLLLLCNMCAEKNTEFDKIISDCSSLTHYGVVTRYPSFVEITEAETLIAIDKSRNIYQFIQMQLPAN